VSLLYPTLYLLRRFLLAFIIAFLKSSPWAQLSLSNIISMLYLSFYIKTHPYLPSYMNHLEAFNESCILLSNALAISFTVDNDAIKNESIGWLLIGLVCAQTVVNIIVMLWEIQSTIRAKMCKKKAKIEG
jgi:Transient receptor potential (TRP) ion channel